MIRKLTHIPTKFNRQGKTTPSPFQKKKPEKSNADTTPSPPHKTKYTLTILSEDHRGTPENPGRVVTLIARSFWETLDDHHPSKSDKVWGTAYRIEADKVKEVKDYLDIREIKCVFPFFCHRFCLLYILPFFSLLLA